MSSLQGGCPCKTIRYELQKPPLFVHCCHCTWCQKESGSAFALNALIGTNEMRLLSTVELKMVHTPTPSGAGQMVARCPTCFQTLWSNYGGQGDFVRAVKVGTLDDPSKVPPSINIYTSTKLPWVTLDSSIPAMPEYYQQQDMWPKESLARLQQIAKLATAGADPITNA